MANTMLDDILEPLGGGGMAQIQRGAASLASALDRNHDGSILDDLAQGGGELLGSLFKTR